jgi:hypothetical protein
VSTDGNATACAGDLCHSSVRQDAGAASRCERLLDEVGANGRQCSQSGVAGVSRLVRGALGAGGRQWKKVASTEAKQSSGGTGTTKYENSFAPRGASRHCNRVCAYYQRLLILFTCPIHMAVGDS